MLWTVAVIGMLMLFGLAGVIGVLDARSQRSGWNRLAAARREVFEDRQAIAEQTLAVEAREDALDARERRLTHRERAADQRHDPPAA